MYDVIENLRNPMCDNDKLNAKLSSFFKKLFAWKRGSQQGSS